VANTVVYRGWVTLAPPRRGRDETIILSPAKFFYRPNKYVLAEKINIDTYKYGSYVNMRIWAYHSKIEPIKDYFIHSHMGVMRSEYREISDSSAYQYTTHFIKVNNTNILEELMRYYHHYCIIEITYHANEFDMVSHEMELILLSNYDI